MERHGIDIGAAIRGAVEESIENMTFMAVDTDLDNMVEAPGGGTVTALLSVLEPGPGWVRLTLPRNTAREIARTLYSFRGSDISEAVLEDVTCELLNTIAGRVMKRVLPAECRFSLGLPRMAPGAAEAAAPGLAGGDFLADGNLLTVAVML